MTKTALNIAIVGAGMGGLTAAITLGQQGHRVTVFERTAVLRPVGSAISVWPNGVKVLRALGLGERIDAISGRMHSMRYCDKSGQSLTSFSLEPLYQGSDEGARPISRTLLQQTLLAAAQSIAGNQVKLGTACVDFVQDDDGVEVLLANGSRVRVDVLVIADGSRSAMRSKVVGQDITRSYRGYVNWNGRVAVSPDLADAHEWLQFVGDGKRVSLMPMGDDEFYFFFDVPLPIGTENARSSYREELLAHFSGWAAPVQTLIQRMDPELVARVEIHDTTPLPSLVNKRVALLGDAAHAMTPDLGQGGCQAMEDAWVLAECLTSESNAPEKALLAYQSARCERVGSIVARARTRAELIHGSAFAIGRPLDEEDDTAVDTGHVKTNADRNADGAVSDATTAWYAELAQENGDAIIAGLLKTVKGGPLP